MKNLSWLYYKGYYDEFQHWDNIKPGDENTKKQINSFFQLKNDSFTKAVFSDFKNIKQPNPQNEKISFKLKTIYPGLLMGSGYSHGIGAIGEFKIGFQLDYVSGLPIIPGSSVKGVIRSAFPTVEINKVTKKLDFGASKATYAEREKEKVKAKWILALLENINEPDFLSLTIQPKEINADDKIDYFNKLLAEIFEGVRDINTEKPEHRFYSIYKRNIFFEAIPVKSEHKGNLLYGDDSITPHHPNLLKNPIPLLFLKVLPNITYVFHFKLNDSEMEPALKKDKLLLLFQKILLTLGIGAKTNVGYGQFELCQSPVNNTTGGTGTGSDEENSSQGTDGGTSTGPDTGPDDLKSNAEAPAAENRIEIVTTWKDMKVGSIVRGTLINYKNGNSVVSVVIEGNSFNLNIKGGNPGRKSLLLVVKHLQGKLEKGNLSVASATLCNER